MITTNRRLLNNSKSSRLSRKYEGIVGGGWNKEARELYREAKRDIRTLEKAQSRNHEMMKNLINKLPLGSYKIDKKSNQDNTYQAEVVDNIDHSGSTKVISRTSKNPKNIYWIFKNSRLWKDDYLVWVVLSDSDYHTQLCYGLPKKVIPKYNGLMKAGDKVFLDPGTFFNLAKLQVDKNDKFLIMFDRDTTKRKDGAVNFKVFNPANPDKHDKRNDYVLASDDEFSRRFRTSGAVSNTKGNAKTYKDKAYK